MIDVNKITSTLAKLPDQQLQQYAQMHKNDPYIMALAMSESNRRKEMRASGQGAMQEQPKVVDQEIARMGNMEGASPEQLARLAQMLDAQKEAEYKEFTRQSPQAPAQTQQMPEDQGIGQLPTGEMNFAGGGIVAFADGGDVERYQSAGLVQDPRLASLLAARERYLRSNADTSAIDQAIAALQAKSTQGATQTAAPLNIPTGGDFAEQMMQGITAPTFAPAPSFTPAVNRSMLNRVEQPARANAAVYGAPAKVEAKGKGKTDSGAPTDKAAAPTAPGAADPFSMKSIREAQEEAMRDVNYQRGALRNEAVGLSNLYQQQGEDRLARRKKEIEEEGDIFKGRESRLNAREADIGRQRNENKGLAFLNAGLAIMSTRGGLATALGQGAQVGTAQYAAGLKDLRAAQQRLDDARDNIEELRLNRKDMNKKDIRALEKERDDNINKGKELLFGVAKETYGADEKSATELFKSYIQGQTKVYEQGQENLRNRERVQGMIAARGDTAGTKQSRVAIDALKAQATNLTNQLKDIPAVGTNNLARRQPLETQLALINAQLAQMSGLGTMLPASPTGARGGVQFLGYE